MDIIYRGSVLIAYGDVQHIEKHWYQGDERLEDNYRGIVIVTKYTKWSTELDNWDNPVYLEREEADKFIESWSAYKSSKEPFVLPIQIPQPQDQGWPSPYPTGPNTYPWGDQPTWHHIYGPPSTTSNVTDEHIEEIKTQLKDVKIRWEK